MPSSRPLHLIKRYGGTRLYDTAAARYVTRADIAELAGSGARVGVIDAATGEDLTRSVLAREPA
jgi:polyhydroxyalkanoate synthesis repressor PhaR